MKASSLILSTLCLFRTSPLLLISALLLVPLLSNAAPVVPTTNGLNADWAEIANINGINVHRGDGSYVQSLPAHATNWTASSAGDYYFVSVVGDDWRQWQRSVVVTLTEEAPDGTIDIGLQTVNGLLRWLPISADWRDEGGNTLVGINVHSALDGRYLSSIGSTELSWTPPVEGDYYLVLVTESDWSLWPRTNTVTVSGDLHATVPPILDIENGQLNWDSLAGNSAVRSINVHRENGDYVTTLDKNATTYVPAEYGSYYIVAVIGDDWQNWLRSNTVTYRDVQANPILTASGYQEILGETLDFFRADYFQPYMQVVIDTMWLWQPYLPSVTNTFETMATWDEFSSEDDDRSCDSGTVDRVVTDLSTPGLGSVPELSAAFVYYDCVLGDRTINGSIMISMQGDSPARLGGQVHTEWIEWISVTISQDSESSTLSGRYTHRDGFGGPYRSFTEGFSTSQFTLNEQFDGRPDYTVTIIDSLYEVAFRSSYFSEDADISLIENGQLTIADDNISAEMTMTDFSYDGDVQNSDGVISLSMSENIEDGIASLVFSDGSSLQISKDNATEDTVQYAISDGTETTYVLDGWLQPVRCEDVALGVFSDYSACP